jgi:uncharacterized protein YbaP (TraB family)
MAKRTPEIVAIAFLALLVSPAIGAGAEGATATPDKVFVWRVTSETTTAYLMGSIHLARKGFYPLDDAIEDAFAASSTLVVEADVLEADPTEMEELMLRHGTYSGDETLEDQLSAQTLEKLKRLLNERGYPYEGMSTMKPWMLSMLLTMLEFQRLGFDPRYGIDLHFLTRAKEAGKAVRELESVTFQVELLSGFSPELQELFLDYTLDETADMTKVVDELVGAWRLGDAEAIEALFHKYERQDASFGPMMEAMLYGRNVPMADKIRGYLEDPDNTYFVVVGAGHLVGERGILDLLEGDGRYRIEQLVATEPATPEPALAH